MTHERLRLSSLLISCPVLSEVVTSIEMYFGWTAAQLLINSYWFLIDLCSLCYCTGNSFVMSHYKLPFVPCIERAGGRLGWGGEEKEGTGERGGNHFQRENLGFVTAVFAS